MFRLSVCALLFVSTASVVNAQAVDELFPAGVAGYDQSAGVTVQTRRRTLYDTPGIRLPGVEIRPTVDQSLFYSTNPVGDGGKGSLISRTSGAATANSTWSRNSLSATVGVDNVHFFDRPIDYTDFNAGIAGGYTLSDHDIAAAFAHRSFHTLGTTIATTRSTTPMLNQNDTARLSYVFQAARFSFTPELTATAYRFGNASVSGTTIDQKFLNRDVVTAGLTTRYANFDGGSLIGVVRGISSRFVNPQPGASSLDSNSLVLLTGLDYQVQGPWRYRLLIGAEFRAFQSSAYGTQITPVLEGSVTWTPTGLTTVTGKATRTINDPQSGGTNGYTLTMASLRIDHELKRNILLEGHAIGQVAEFLQGGTQISRNLGADVTWLLNRNARVSLSYDYTYQTGSGDRLRQFDNTGLSATTTRSGTFVQSLVGVALRFGL